MTFEEFKKQKNPPFRERIKQLLIELPGNIISNIPFIIKDAADAGKEALKFLDNVVEQERKNSTKKE